MHKLHIAILTVMLPFMALAQNGAKGTIHVKKLPAPVLKIDSAKRVDARMAGVGFIAFMKKDTLDPEFIAVTENGITPKDPERAFVNKNKSIPDCYKCKGTTVFTELSFLIHKDGTLSDFEIAKGAKDCPQCDAESLRIAKLMPNWQPANNKGVPIDLKWHMTITYAYAK